MTEQQDKEQGRFLGLWWLQRAASSYLGQLLCEWERTPISFKPLLFVMLCVCAPLSCFGYVQPFAMPWTVAHQAPLSLGFSRQEYWSGLPFPSPGVLPDPGIEPASPSSPALAGRFFITSATLLLGEAHRLKPPTLARHHSNHLHELFYDRVLVRNTELISHHQPKEFRKGQKETPHVRPPPRILLAGIHLDWTRCAPPGRTLSQNDWLKTTRKLTPSP